MLRRRPVPRNAGVVACLLALAGCAGDQVSVAPGSLAEPVATTCDRLLEALPGTLDGQPRREVEPADAPAAAWGEPPIVLRCGVPEPAGFDQLSVCQVADGVGWFIPEEQMADQPADIVMTSVDRRPRVEVRVPEEHLPPAAAMVQLAPALKRATERTDTCR